MGLPIEGELARQPLAGDFARRDVPTCRLAERIADVRARVLAAGWQVCIVTDESGVVLGRLRKDELHENPKAIVEQVMEAGPSTIRPDTKLEQITQRMQAKHLDHVVVTTLDGRLVGVLLRQEAEERLKDSAEI